MYNLTCYIGMEPSEILNEAIMSKTPFVVVEGVDDVPVYERLLESIEKDIIVIDIKNLTNSEGCHGVTEFILNLNSLSYNGELGRHIVGIIDRDIRPYRNEVIEGINNIIMLNYYSIESHFLSLESVEHIVKNTTRAGRLLNDQVLTMIYSKAIEETIDIIFYPSLDALKNGCVEGYSSTFRYRMSIEQVLNINLTEDKKNELDLFSEEKSLSRNLESILLFSKGKWIFKLFCSKVINIIDDLNVMCREGKILKCQYCLNGNEDDCQYKKIRIGTIEVICSDVLRSSSLRNLNYVLSKVRDLILH